MAWKIVLLSFLALILLLLFVPIGARLTFDGELCARVRIFGIPFTLYPQKDKKRRPKKAKKKPPKVKKEKPEKETLAPIAQMLKEDGPGAVIHYLTAMASLVSAAVRRLLAALIVDKLQLELTVAGEDAAETAILHGAACAAVFPALAAIQNFVRIRRRAVTVSPDFLGGESGVKLDIRLHAYPGRLLWAALRFFGGYLANTLKDSRAEEPPSMPRTQA